MHSLSHELLRLGPEHQQIHTRGYARYEKAKQIRLALFERDQTRGRDSRSDQQQEQGLALKVDRKDALL